MTGGGQLNIAVERLELAEVRALTLGRLTPGAWVCLSISDTGVGLTASQISSIFEPFYTTRGAEQGTGIGLTVVRHILMRMGGALDVHSRVGAGTRICVYWRACAPDAAGVEMPREPATPGRGETVMVVDDRPELVSLAEEVLASLGYEPVGFSSARAALQAFRAQPRRFDALVTDERMDGMGGCELAKEIHAIEPKLPVILATGYRDAELVLRAKDAGIAEILDKPLNTQVLSAALSRQLAGARRKDARS
jgi:CheY-like chemotaxis protein